MEVNPNGLAVRASSELSFPGALACVFFTAEIPRIIYYFLWYYFLWYYFLWYYFLWKTAPRN